MLISLMIQGVAVFRLSRKIWATAASSRGGGDSPVSSPAVMARSRAREALPAQSMSRREWSTTSWVAMAGRSQPSSSTAAARTVTSSRSARFWANRSRS